MTHWKKLTNPDYLGSWAFEPGQEIIATISHVTQDTVTGSDGKKEVCTIVHFSESDIKPLILNNTNAQTISKVCRSPYIEQWSGHRIQLYVQSGIRAFGTTTDAVRIRPTEPKPSASEAPCEGCGNPIKPAWNMDVADLITYSKANTGRTLCADCLRAAAAQKVQNQGGIPQ